MVSASAVYDRQPIREGNEHRAAAFPDEARLPTYHEGAACIRQYGLGRDDTRYWFHCPMWVWALYRRTTQDEFHEIMSDPEERACAEALWRLR